MKSKKAQSLPMNTIIIAIIVVVVLVIILVFFIGGTSSIAQKIRDLFTGATAGTDLQTATQFCQEYCEQERTTAWCAQTFRIDKDGDNIAQKDEEGKYIQYYCGAVNKGQNSENNLGISCGKITACTP